MRNECGIRGWARRFLRTLLLKVTDGPAACPHWPHKLTVWGIILLTVLIGSTMLHWEKGTSRTLVDGGVDGISVPKGMAGWKRRRPRYSSWSGNRWRGRRMSEGNATGKRRHQACGTRGGAVQAVDECEVGWRETATACEHAPTRRCGRWWRLIVAILWLAHGSMAVRLPPGRIPICTAYFSRAVRIGQAGNPGPSYARLDSASASGESEVSSAGWSIQDQYEAMGHGGRNGTAEVLRPSRHPARSEAPGKA